MPPRGLKALLKKSSPGKLVGSGRFKGYQRVEQGYLVGSKLRGVTKRLDKKLFSTGTLPLIARRAVPRPGGHWTGQSGGRSRGAKVDAQITRIINGGASALKKIQHCYVLTRLIFAALKAKKLEPVMAQRVVVSQRHRLGTAADFVCYDAEKQQLVIVELKTGFDNGRLAAAQTAEGKPCRMQAPMSKVEDCNVNRHLSQLAVTRELFVKETDTINKLAELGVSADVEGLLLYATDSGVEFFSLNAYWKKRGGKIINRIS